MSFFRRVKGLFETDMSAGKAGQTLKVDFHSHLLPGIDDGAATMEQSVAMIRRIHESGIEKIITTPHIMYEFYRNTPEIINGKLELVKEELKKEGIGVRLEAAAEYYIDDHFISMVDRQEPLLTFGNRMVLVETNYVQSHPRLKEVFFNLKIQGYNPVFAHPERYMYLYKNKRDFSRFEDLFDFGVLFQANMMSFMGYYGTQIREVAMHLLKEEMIHLVGSDIHKMEHVKVVNHLKSTRIFEKIMALQLKNNSLL